MFLWNFSSDCDNQKLCAFGSGWSYAWPIQLEYETNMFNSCITKVSFTPSLIMPLDIIQYYNFHLTQPTSWQVRFQWKYTVYIHKATYIITSKFNSRLLWINLSHQKWSAWLQGGVEIMGVLLQQRENLVNSPRAATYSTHTKYYKNTIGAWSDFGFKNQN